MAFTLRGYQTDAKALTYQRISEGHTPIVCAPTGSGKTVVAADMALDAMQAGELTLFISFRREILHQTYEAFAEHCGSRNVQLLMAGEPYYAYPPITVASADTLKSRWEKSPVWQVPAQRILADEAHLSLSEKMMHTVMPYYRDRTVIGFTATPARASGKGMGSYFTRIIQVRTVQQLIDEGYLAPCEYWAGSHVDVSKVKTVRGDYEQKGLAKEANNRMLIGDIVDNWLRLAKDRHTIVFAVDIAHAMALTERFQAAGVAAECVHSKMTTETRSMITDQFKRRSFDVLVNVGIACLDEASEILTTQGWVGYRDITYEHRIANWDNGRIFFEHPLAIEVRDRRTDERMVALETKNRSVRVTEDHRMLYRTWPVGQFKECRAHQLVDRAAQLPICGEAEPLDVVPAQEPRSRRKLWQNAHMLRQAGFVGDARAEAERRATERDALRYLAPGELTEAQCEFIGFWLGDGSRHKNPSGSTVYTLAQAERYIGICAWIERLIESIHVDAKRRRSHDRRANRGPMAAWVIPRGTGFGPQKRRGVYAIEPYLDKDGSALLWGLNASQFAALMRGLWMADGDHLEADEPITDRWRISNTNRQLFDLLQAIACCRGYRANITDGISNTKKGHRPLWKLSVSRRDSHAMTKYRLQFENAWRPEKVWCVQSHSSYIVTRRRGTVTITGNTYGYDVPSVNCVVLARPTKSIVFHLQSIGRGMRPKPDGGYCVVLDHADNVRRLGCAEDLIRWRLDEGSDAATNVSQKEREARGETLTDCGNCGHKFSRSRICPKCGWEKPAASKDIEVVQADLVRVRKTKSAAEVPVQERREWYAMARKWCEDKGKKVGMAYYAYKEKFGIYPAGQWNNDTPVAPDVRVGAYMQYKLIKAAKSRRRA